MSDVVSVIDFEVLRYFVYVFAMVSTLMQVYMAYSYSRILSILSTQPHLPR